MSPVLLQQGNFDMDFGGSKTGPPLLTEGPGDGTVCSAQTLHKTQLSKRSACDSEPGGFPL